MGKKTGFDKAFEELKGIVEKLQDEEAGIDSLSTQLKRAKELVETCRQKLREVEDDIDAIEFEEGEP